jgi:peroxiredoxin-like protein
MKKGVGRMENLSFTIHGVWHGDRLGEGNIEAEGLNTAVSLPKEMGGPGVGTNPEELLIAAATNCYMITLAAILSRRNIPYEKFEVKSVGRESSDGKRLKFEQIVHKPVIVLKSSDPELQSQVEELTHRAEKACFISQTLKGNVDIAVEPDVRLSYF